MIKTLMGSIRDYMKVTIATPLLVLGEVICQMTIPFITADMIDAIKDGTVTCIGTDHAPHSAEDKAKGAAGMVGLETAFAVCYTKLCRMEGLPLEMLSFLMSSGPRCLAWMSIRAAWCPALMPILFWWIPTTCLPYMRTSCTVRAKTAPMTAKASMARS